MKSVAGFNVVMLSFNVELVFDNAIDIDFIGANINILKIPERITVESIQKFDLPSDGSNFNNQNNNPTAMMFLIMASTGVIGINSPKQPQLPELPLINVS